MKKDEERKKLYESDCKQTKLDNQAAFKDCEAQDSCVQPWSSEWQDKATSELQQQKCKGMCVCREVEDMPFPPMPWIANLLKIRSDI